ncbi:MAG TPA: hypothetical protein DCQ64_26555 [Candidatus Rokubacteria bacterium]|nr:hypothetical protein [Candidatus Rokubacteria bacterium]
MKTATRLMPLGQRSYLREVVDEAETVIASEPLTRRQAADTGLPLPKAAPGREPRLSARRALLRLLVAHQNEVVTHADVEAELGRRVSRQCVWAAAGRIGADLPVVSVRGPGGGYSLVTEPREVAS